MQLKLENIDIHYQLYHSPKTNTDYIIMIHGMGLDSTTWEPIIPFLQEYYHILTFDIRGHGHTKGPSDNMSWETLLDDFNSLVKALGIEEFHLAGLGFGGNLAIKYNEVYPDKVKKLILTSVYMHFPENVTKKEIQKRKQLVKEGKMSELSKNMIHQICYNLTPEKELLLTKAYEKVDLSTYFRTFKLLYETVTLNDLKQIENEVLFMQGDSDPLFPIQQTNLYQSYLKNAISYIVPYSSNLVPLDNPRSFATLVGYFIKEGISSNFNTVMEQEFINNIDDLVSESFNTLEINIINGFSVKYKGMEVEGKWNQRKAKNLLAYLAYHNPSTRDELIEEFWRENDLTNAKNNLRVALNHLKRILIQHNLEFHLEINREHIRLVGDISFDLSNFMYILMKCRDELDPVRKKALYEELVHSYDDRMFLNMYDEWLLIIQHKIEKELYHISKTI